MTFEETYPRYAFSELVRLGLTVAKFVIRFRTWREKTVEAQQKSNFDGEELMAPLDARTHERKILPPSK